MKKVKLVNIIEPIPGSVFTKDKYYHVILGNGVRKQVKNKQAAISFLNETNRYLTYKLHECNELFISCFTYYRRAWFYFDHPGTGRTHDLAGLYKSERVIESSIESITKAFNILYERSESENGNHFVFVHFSAILSSCATITNELLKFYKTRSIASTIYELEILQTKISYCKRTIDNYTIELENQFKEIEITDLTILKTG